MPVTFPQSHYQNPGTWKQHVFTTIALSWGQVITICDLPNSLPTKSMGEVVFA